MKLLLSKKNEEEKSIKAKAATEVFTKKFLKPLETVKPQKRAAVLFAKTIISNEVLKEFHRGPNIEIATQCAEGHCN